MEVAVEISKIIINETVAQQVIVLKETEGERRFFPMVIGMPEILAIDRRLKGLTYPRPLTHDLLANITSRMARYLEDEMGARGVKVSHLNSRGEWRYGTSLVSRRRVRGGGRASKRASMRTNKRESGRANKMTTERTKACMKGCTNE